MGQMIFTAISEAMKACDAVGKDSKNPQQGYKYRGIDAVMNAINPALIKAKIFAAPEVLETSREERHTAKGGLLIYSIAKVKYTFYAEDGSNVSATVIGEGMDSGDKSMNKAMSAAFKYALFQVFCIPTEEMIDSEKDDPEPLSKGNTQKETQAVAGQQHIGKAIEVDNPTAADIQNIAAEAAQNLDADKVTDSTLGQIQYLMQKKGIMDAVIRKTYGVKSLRELTVSQGEDCLNRLEATKDRA